MTGNNPKSLRYQAACVRQIANDWPHDDPGYEALNHAADNLDKLADAAPIIKAILNIYAQDIKQ